MESPDAQNARDVRLMQRVGQGDADAFEELVRIHQSAVIGTIAKMLGDIDEAHDIAQQVFLRVWKSAPRYVPKAKFTTWLFTIVRNLVFNETRRRSSRPVGSLEEREEQQHLQIADDDGREPDAQVLQRELREAVDAAIAELPEKQRMAVVLRRYEDLPYDEIATVLDVSLASVKSLLFRARADLKIRLQSYLDADQA